MPNPSHDTSDSARKGEEDEGFFDDAGRWWPSNAEWCDRCQGMGTEECLCAGDFCCCGAGDDLECRRCHGEGYYIVTPKIKREREEFAKIMSGFLTTPPDPSKRGA